MLADRLLLSPNILWYVRNINETSASTPSDFTGQALRTADRARIRQQIRFRRTAALVASLAVVGVMVAVPVRTFYSSWKGIHEDIAQQKKLQHEAYLLTKQKQELTDPMWIESQARNRLMMARPGERVYRFEKKLAPKHTQMQRKKIERDNNPWYTTLWNDISVPQ